jgi:AraC-like DNA-binding protein
MDLLTDILVQAGLRRRLIGLHELPDATTLHFPCDKSIGFHVVVSGRSFVHTGVEVIALRAGDVALMARGQDHKLSTVEKLSKRVIELHEWSVLPRALEAGAASVVSGAYQLWHTPVHPLFQELPDWYVLRGEAEGKLSPLSLAIELLAEETKRPDLGSQTVVNSLLDVIFSFILRRIVAESSANKQGFGQAVRDAQVRRALELMHEDCARPWTLVELAKQTGLRAAMGDTPLNYLRSLRVQAAMRLLCETEQSLEQVAGAIGYSDAFSFSKVFKRSVGMAPREFRQKNAQESAHAFRFRESPSVGGASG